MSPSANDILLVEDNADDASLALRAFKRSQARSAITVARDGVEAIDYLFARGHHSDRVDAPLPALVLLDLKLPKLDGLGVLRVIRADARTRLLPVIVLTSSTEDADLTSCYALGANSYVQKPIDFAAFLETVTVMGTYWLTMNRTPTTRNSA